MKSLQINAIINSCDFVWFPYGWPDDVGNGIRYTNDSPDAGMIVLPESNPVLFDRKIYSSTQDDGSFAAEYI